MGYKEHNAARQPKCAFKIRYRSKVYQGRCLDCGSRVPIKVSFEYDPLLGHVRSYLPPCQYECLKCGNTERETLRLYTQDKKRMLKDYLNWMQRVDFIARISPAVEKDLALGAEPEEFMKGLRSEAD